MDPDLEIQLRLAVSCSMAREHGNIFIRNALWLVVTLPPLLAAAGYAGLRLLRWTTEDPEQAYARRLWLALWTCGFILLATAVIVGRIALTNLARP
jgi:hypothetical protein